jgi:uncharacterized protein
VTRRIVLAGGSGFLGRALAAELSGDGSEVVILTRSPRKTSATNLLELAWDGVTLGPWLSELEGAHALINLTGRSVDCRYTAENRREIVESRVNSVRLLGSALARVQQPPAAWVQASSLAIYGDAGDRVCDDDAPHGRGFSAGVCEQWERAFDEVDAPRTRKVALRIGFVLGKGGGALGRLATLARAGLGGTVGSGDQYLSWLHLSDMNALFRASIDRADFRGTYNATGPTPVPNREFMRALRRALGRGWSPPVPSFAVHIGAAFIGTEASLALTGRRCVPRRLEQQGFTFRWTDLDAALKDVLA